MAEHDPVNNPAHYTSTKISPIDVIEDHNLNFCRGNVVKYLLRAGKKDDELEDLSKALWYLQHEIDNLKQKRKDESKA